MHVHYVHQEDQSVLKIHKKNMGAFIHRNTYPYITHGYPKRLGNFNMKQYENGENSMIFPGTLCFYIQCIPAYTLFSYNKCAQAYTLCSHIQCAPTYKYILLIQLKHNAYRVDVLLYAMKYTKPAIFFKCTQKGAQEMI